MIAACMQGAEEIILQQEELEEASKALEGKTGVFWYENSRGTCHPLLLHDGLVFQVGAKGAKPEAHHQSSIFRCVGAHNCGNHVEEEHWVHDPTSNSSRIKGLVVVQVRAQCLPRGLLARKLNA
eukprot:Mycagemm_TRINITY_DN9915_c0_g1::TRINITY_DN9915_c0_g1_i1::g.3387::m.3387 type:complete len:124 gc:universal TRINITY_DN9915_c0_g1_i1:298-669(+)